MATLIQFAPSPLAAFQFLAVLDGQTYTCTVTWNVFGQRWYLTIETQDGTRVVTEALIGSPPDFDISLTAGYFASTMVFRQATQVFEIAP